MNCTTGCFRRIQGPAPLHSHYTYSYQGPNILYEKNVTGSTTTITKHFYAGELQVAKMVIEKVYYLHEDALGSVRLEATSSGTITFSSDYVPFGSNYGVSGKEVFMYTGEPYDSVTGLYLFGARYYDPTIGRFITEDSYSGNDNDPMTLNRYIYARDNPEKIVDPSGHFGHVMLTDYNDQGFMDTLVATTTPGGQTAYLAPTQTTTVSVGDTTTTVSTTTFVTPDGSIVTYTGATVTSTEVSGGQVVSHEAVLASGWSKSSAPTIGTTGPTTGSQVLQCLSGPCGATGVAVGAVTVTGVVVATGEITLGSLLVLPELAIGTGFTLGYVAKYGDQSTPGGAIGAFITGFTVLFHPYHPFEYPGWLPPIDF